MTNLGPVGLQEPILVKIGDQHIIAFFIPERGECGVNAVTWKDADTNAPYASVRVRVSLKPGQVVQLDGSQRQSMASLRCRRIEPGGYSARRADPGLARPIAAGTKQEG